MIGSGGVLLDTHVWLWVAAGESRRIGPRTRRLIDRASSGNLYVSAASAFEIAALHTAGHLRLTQTVETWIRDALHHLGARIADVDSRIAIDAGLVPVTAVPDPVDRLLVASARAMDVRLVTRDGGILRYAAKTKLVRVIDASK